MVPDARSAQMVLPCQQLDETIAFFERLGLRIEAIFPADSPTVAILSGLGVRLRLDTTATGDAGRIRLLCDTPPAENRSDAAARAELVAPNGTVIELVDADPPVELPALVPSLVITRQADGDWGVGRAGMRYRDLIPGRLGGRFIASNIAIEHAGPVSDYVHYHRVRFQMIFVRRGWVRVVYEGQGEPFVMQEGDCVLQPPQIRHRVLENSDGFEVVEVSCPAEHETYADWSTDLPSPRLPSDHTWSGQRFVRHVAEEATWAPWHHAGFECRDTGISEATNDLAGVRIVRPESGVEPSAEVIHDGELWLGHLVHGSLDLVVGGSVHQLSSGDSFAIPAAAPVGFSRCSPDLELLEVTLPA